MALSKLDSTTEMLDFFSPPNEPDKQLLYYTTLTLSRLYSSSQDLSTDTPFRKYLHVFGREVPPLDNTKI